MAGSISAQMRFVLLFIGLKVRDAEMREKMPPAISTEMATPWFQALPISAGSSALPMKNMVANIPMKRPRNWLRYLRKLENICRRMSRPTRWKFRFVIIAVGKICGENKKGRGSGEWWGRRLHRHSMISGFFVMALKSSSRFTVVLRKPSERATTRVPSTEGSM